MTATLSRTWECFSERQPGGMCRSMTRTASFANTRWCCGSCSTRIAVGSSAGACGARTGSSAAAAISCFIVSIIVRRIGRCGPLHLDHVDQFLHRAGRLLQRLVLFGRQGDLDDLLDAPRAEFHRHADEQVADAVLALQKYGARQDLLLVLEN